MMNTSAPRSLRESTLPMKGREEFSLDDARNVLRHTFGHSDFRGRQADVIGEVLAGRNALAVLPTGGGKSVCYQIPAMLRPGVGLVVSPLIALMSDQVEALKQLGVAAARLDSGQTYDARDETWRRLIAGELDLIYFSPEGLMAGNVLERLADAPLSLIAIDEAHCVSQWGHDFRPEYRALGRLAGVFPGVPRLAVTATADARTRADIMPANLNLEGAAEFVASFARPELSLSAEPKSGTRRRPGRAQLVKARAGQLGGRLLRLPRWDGEGWRRVSSLGRCGGAAPITPVSIRQERARKSARGSWPRTRAVMTATIAFGMGIDKPDVRFVIHADPPSVDRGLLAGGGSGRVATGQAAEGITLYSRLRHDLGAGTRPAVGTRPEAVTDRSGAQGA